MIDQPANIAAVILAAGIGSRIGDIANGLPKSLMTIGPVSSTDARLISLLERQIVLLKSLKIASITVVVGYHKEAVIDKIGWTGVDIVENNFDDLKKSGSLHSFQFAANAKKNILKNHRYTMLMDADIVYEYRTLAEFIQTLNGSGLLIHPKFKGDSEEVLVYGKENTPAVLGKNLLSQQTPHHTCFGEAMGIVAFSQEDSALLHTITDDLLQNQFKQYQNYCVEHEALSQQLMLLKKLKAYYAPKDSLFLEVDFANDYYHVRDQLYPELLQKEQNILGF